MLRLLFLLPSFVDPKVYIILSFFGGGGGGGRCGPTWAMASSFMRFLDQTQRHISAARNPLVE